MGLPRFEFPYGFRPYLGSPAPKAGRLPDYPTALCSRKNLKSHTRGNTPSNKNRFNLIYKSIYYLNHFFPFSFSCSAVAVSASPSFASPAAAFSAFLASSAAFSSSSFFNTASCSAFISEK